MTPRFSVQALGEVAIRCADKPAMVAFYRDVIRLSPMNDTEAPIAFFRIAEGYAGHTAVLALFDHSVGGAGGIDSGNVAPKAGTSSTLHHIALTVAWQDQDAVVAWYEHLGRAYRVEHFHWVGWRGIFTNDPDGNTVEVVAKDPDWVPAR